MTFRIVITSPHTHGRGKQSINQWDYVIFQLPSPKIPMIIMLGHMVFQTLCFIQKYNKLETNMHSDFESMLSYSHLSSLEVRCKSFYIISCFTHLAGTSPPPLWTSGCTGCIVHRWGGSVYRLPAETWRQRSVRFITYWMCKNKSLRAQSKYPHKLINL